MAESTAFAPGQWQRLSPWAIAHFAQKSIIQNIRILLLGGASAYLGSARMRSYGFPWVLPSVIVALVLIGSTIAYVFYRYRVVDDAVQVKRGALFKQHLNLSFGRIQNISIEQPFYFRPFGLATLKIDSAGSQGEEVNLAALTLGQAEAMREFILRKKQLGRPALDARDPHSAEAHQPHREEAFYSRSVRDLIVHGLTNNRSFIVVAAIFGFLAQSGLSPPELAQRLGVDFDFVVAGLSVVRIVFLVALSFIAAVGAIALLSVLVSIFTYYGFTMYRTGDSLAIKRGLLTKHEIHVKKSRIQAIQLRQDWLDRLLGRYNVILERITHSSGQGDPMAAQSRRILVPSVRADETAVVTDEILPGCRPDRLPFSPIHVRWFYKNAAIVSAIYLAAVGIVLALPERFDWMTAILLVAWPLHGLRTWLRWKAGGLAIDGDIVVVRSGAIGIDYQLFATDKIQDVSHIQSVLMRRHGLSSLGVHTASTSIRVPYMPTSFVRKVVDYCAFRVESSARSWM